MIPDRDSLDPLQPMNGKAHPNRKTNTWNGFVRDASKGPETEEELAVKGSGARGEKRWRQTLNRLRKKMIDGDQLTTEEIESVLLWKALGWIREAKPELADKGLELLETIYETRSRAKMAPGNNPAKVKKTGLGAKYGTEIEERTTPKAVPETEETPRSWIGEP